MIFVSKGIIYAISISSERGQPKKEVSEANFIENYGIENDGHAGNWNRQVTCLNFARVIKGCRVKKGDLAEII